MSFVGCKFHQPESTVLGIQPERKPYQYSRCYNTKRDTTQIVNTCHVHDNKHEEDY